MDLTPSFDLRSRVRQHAAAPRTCSARHALHVSRALQSRMDAANNNSPVVEFYNDKTVFITGATGFMGKVLVEKLLRSTNVKKLLVLIRPKKGVKTELRLKTLLESSVFDRLINIFEDSICIQLMKFTG